LVGHFKEGKTGLQRNLSLFVILHFHLVLELLEGKGAEAVAALAAVATAAAASAAATAASCA